MSRGCISYMMNGCVMYIIFSIIGSLVFMAIMGGCHRNPSVLPQDEFEISVNKILDDENTKVIELNTRFHGEQAIGSREGNGGSSFVGTGYGKKPTDEIEASFLIFVHQTTIKRPDGVIREVSYAVIPKREGSRAGGISTHVSEHEGKLQDDIDFNLPSGRFKLDSQLSLGRAFGQPVSIYVGSPQGWEATKPVDNNLSQSPSPVQAAEHGLADNPGT